MKTEAQGGVASLHVNLGMRRRARARGKLDEETGGCQSICAETLLHTDRYCSQRSKLVQRLAYLEIDGGILYFGRRPG